MDVAIIYFSLTEISNSMRNRRCEVVLRKEWLAEDLEILYMLKKILFCWLIFKLNCHTKQLSNFYK